MGEFTTEGPSSAAFSFTCGACSRDLLIAFRLVHRLFQAFAPSASLPSTLPWSLLLRHPPDQAARTVLGSTCKLHLLKNEVKNTSLTVNCS